MLAGVLAWLVTCGSTATMGVSKGAETFSRGADTLRTAICLRPENSVSATVSSTISVQVLRRLGAREILKRCCRDGLKTPQETLCLGARRLLTSGDSVSESSQVKLLHTERSGRRP